jgi:hypothetical protein
MLNILKIINHDRREKYHLHITNHLREFTKSTVQLLSLLAEKNTIVFVEYPLQ